MKIGYVGSNTRSLGQILEKPCVCSKDQIFGLILLKLGQSVCLDESVYMFENGSLGEIIPCLEPRGCDLNPCCLMLYHRIRKSQGSDSRTIMALLFISSPEHRVLSELL